MNSEPRQPGGSDSAARTLLTLAVAVLLWLLPTFAGPWIDPEKDIGIILALRWVAAALLVAYVLVIERRTLASLGIAKPRARDLLITVGLGLVAVIVGIGLLLLAQGGPPDDSTQTGRIITGMGTVGLVHLIVNAAVVEELFYRGLLMERVIDLTGRRWVAAVVSGVLFIGGHIAGSGWTSALTVVLVGTLLFVGLYWWRRNLPLCVTAHVVVDLPVLLAG